VTPEAIAFVREVTQARGIADCERVQSLWGGYGELLRARLEGAALASVIVKWVTVPNELRGAKERISDARKRRSYEVETEFYASHAARCEPSCRVPRRIGHRQRREESILVLEDLGAAGYTRRESDPTGASLDACLAWLASFHATFVGMAPAGLWPVGTYWHLGTRQQELERMQDTRLKARAHELDHALSSAHYRTFVHGDAKPDNFCFTEDGRTVAAVDFQYVGGGVGTKDVAYLLHGLSPRDEARALETYFAELRPRLEKEIATPLEKEWRTLYPMARDDFRRFLDGWRR
jgi:hypothetical protein